MSTVTDNDLKELKDLINSKFEQVDRKLEKISDDIIELKVNMATLKTEVTAVNKRLDNLDFIARSMVVGIIIALLGGLAKMLYPNLFS